MGQKERYPKDIRAHPLGDRAKIEQLKLIWKIVIRDAYTKSLHSSVSQLCYLEEYFPNLSHGVIQRRLQLLSKRFRLYLQLVKGPDIVHVTLIFQACEIQGYGC